MNCVSVKAGHPCLNCLYTQKDCMNLELANLSSTPQFLQLLPSPQVQTKIFIESGPHRHLTTVYKNRHQPISVTFDEVVHWRRNIFSVLSGNEGKGCVSELLHLFRAYMESTTLESIALKASTMMLALLLQNCIASSSQFSDHITFLKEDFVIGSQKTLPTCCRKVKRFPFSGGSNLRLPVK